MINLYCDESCHLPNDDSPIMVIGGISCPQSKVKTITREIYNIKRKHGVYKYAEIKWTRVSNSKIGMYKDLIDLFFDSPFLCFRAVVAMNKKNLQLEKFKLTYDDWYQRIYYLMLKEVVCNIEEQYSIYVDIKDTKGSEKINKLKKVLNYTLFDFYEETVSKIQLVDSSQIQLMQLTDLMIGAVSYINRGLKTSAAKIELIKYISKKSGNNLIYTTPRTKQKYNIFIWNAKEM